ATATSPSTPTYARTRLPCYTDKDGKIYVVEVGGGRTTEIADEPIEYTTDYAWSPDGRFLALAVRDPSGISVLHIWDADAAKVRRVSDGVFNVHTLAWDPKGNYLYYLSEREFQPQLSLFEFNYAANRATEVYALALRKDVPNPFPPKNDEVGDADAKKDDDADDKAKDGKQADKQVVVRIDFDGLGERVTRVPLEGDNYEGLVATRTHLLYLRRDAMYYGRDSAAKPLLAAFSFEDEKASDLAPEVEGWSVAGDGKKVLVQTKKGLQLYTLGEKEDPKEVATDDLWVDRVPAEEWSNIFGEVWRRYRDHFYVANMHGFDWQKIRAQYEPIVADVADRADLNDLMGQMIAELNVSHAYVAGGDMGLPERPRVALPGARFTLDAPSGRYRIASIFAGQNAEERYRSPLTEVGSDIKVGDFLIAINGQDVVAPQNPYALLQLPPQRPVELTVNALPETKGARRVLYRPIASEADLMYLAWATKNRERVAKATRGRVGYLHVPDMGEDGIREFIKWYYPQVRKEGLIVDVRSNGGGNVSQMLIERLRRTLLGTDFGRNIDVTLTYPDVVFHGPMVTLINETSASDGDIFPYMFRQAGLGPLIGKRTWGGVIGITEHGPLIDGGDVYVPEFGTAGADGQWIIEGHGVEPDIEVDNDPVSVIEGRDPQLERGIEEVMARMAAAPKKLPTRPAAPDKTH
ncbi:MAG: S41 family peptidase, partial [Myxococcota bacterium]